MRKLAFAAAAVGVCLLFAAGLYAAVADVLKVNMNQDLRMGDRLKTADQGNLFVVFGEPDVKRVDVGGGVDAHRADPHFTAGTQHAERDLSSIGDQYLLEHQAGSIRNRSWLYSTGCAFSTRILATFP